MKFQSQSKAVRAFVLCGSAIAFGITYTQNPLYSGNQNSYFLHGLRSTGAGLLANDWMANTLDPFPVFSGLVHFTSLILSPLAFYFYQAVLLAVYFLAILGIACKTFKIEWTSSQLLVCALMLIGLHSAALADLSLGMTGKNIVYLVDVGVAQQSIISHEFLPATFGVLLVLSIYAFLVQRPYLAVALSALAAVFHSSYALSAAILTLTYAAVLFKRERSMVKSVLVVFLGFGLLLPVLIFDLLSFSPTTPGLFAQAEAILAHVRIPQHAEPSRWFNLQAIVMLCVILLAMYLSRKKSVFPILVSGLTAGLILTVVQIVTSSDALALLFPWRVSAWLVPISWGIVIGAVTNSLFAARGRIELTGEKRRIFDRGVVLLIAFLAAYGGWKMYSRSTTPPSASSGEAMMRFVSSSASPNQVYLVPVEMEQFRLSAGVPILVDWKTNPYRDTEVIEWYQRLCAAKKFYDAGSDSAREMLRELRSRYAITHVVLPNGLFVPADPWLHQIYADSAYRVFEFDYARTP